MNQILSIVLVVVVVGILVFLFVKDTLKRIEDEEEKPVREFYGKVICKEPVLAYDTLERISTGTNFIPYQKDYENYPCILTVETDDGTVFLEYYNFQYDVPGIGAKGKFTAKGNRYVSFVYEYDLK